jgi:hypothetical protein
VAGIGHVPITTNDDAAAISIAGVVANRLHVLLATGFVNLIALHPTLDLHPHKAVASPPDRCLETWPALYAEGVCILVSVAIGPAMGATSVHKCSSVVAPSVKEGPRDLPHLNSVPTIVMWVGEMPVTTSQNALAIEIRCVVANRFHLLHRTSFSDAVGIDATSDLDSVKFILVVCECHLLRVILGTQSLAIAIVVVRPAMRVASVHERPTMVGTTTVGVGASEQGARDLVSSSVMRIRQMPIATDNDTLAISICKVVTDWAHALLLAGSIDL